MEKGSERKKKIKEHQSTGVEKPVATLTAFMELEPGTIFSLILPMLAHVQPVPGLEEAFRKCLSNDIVTKEPVISKKIDE